MKSRGRVMVPVPAKAEFGIQGPAQTLHPNASSNNGTNARQLKTQCKCFVILTSLVTFITFFVMPLLSLLSMNHSDNWPLCFTTPSNTDFSSTHSTSLYHSHNTTFAFLSYTGPGTQSSYMCQLLQATFWKLTRIKPRDFFSALAKAPVFLLDVPIEEERVRHL